MSLKEAASPMIKKRVLRDRQSLALGCHISTPGTHSIKDNIYVKILVTLCQSSLHVSHLVALAGYAGLQKLYFIH